MKIQMVNGLKDKIIYDDEIKSCEVDHSVYYSRDPMSIDWEVIMDDYLQ